MELLPYKYFVHFVSNGKVVNSEFCRTLDEVKVLRAIASGKGYDFEVFNLYDGKEEPESVETVSEPTKQKIVWERSVRCIETGQVFSSIRECSEHFGISHKSIWNAIRNGKPRHGLHFVSTSPTNETLKPRKRRVNTWTQRYVCVTTNQTFCSASECMAFCGAPLTSFYRALKQGKPINGLLFKKL